MSFPHPQTLEIVAAALFAVALIHTFSTKYFEGLARRRPAHAGVFHLLAEVEVVFGFWAIVLIAVMMAMLGRQSALDYVDTRNFTEPTFVFVVMVVAASRAILHCARRLVEIIARMMPLRGAIGFYFVTLALVPLLGSFITEPAAMTLAALMLRDRVFAANVSQRLKYATLAVLFVNVSIGGTLTPYAAPPVLMVAAQWQWDLVYMLTHFGWRSALAVAINAIAVTVLFSRQLATLPRARTSATGMPALMVALHLLLLAGIVLFAHHPPMFMGLFLLFMGLASAYPEFQDRLILREGLLVAFFLAGLVVLGGQQQWWLEPLLRAMSVDAVYYGATALTAITDNAALTYLGSQVQGLSEEFKRALVAGAVTGGGLTVIANAPNPAGFAILRGTFDGEVINPFGLLVAAVVPTLVAVAAFRFV